MSQGLLLDGEERATSLGRREEVKLGGRRERVRGLCRVARIARRVANRWVDWLKLVSVEELISLIKYGFFRSVKVNVMVSVKVMVLMIQ
tara:strand:+ start:378 stop:644 length:267 start_codon:yes stop_codon:yes gene_type:complete